MTLSVAVLVCEGRHPTSGRPRRADCDARAVELALRLPEASVSLVHAGSENSPALRDYLGMGIGRLTSLSLPLDADPTPALIHWLSRRAPDVILTGRQAEGGEDGGFLPYRIAHALSRPLMPDACAVRIEDGRAIVTQALPKGRRRRLRAALPVLVTVGPAAPGPRQSAFAKARRGRVNVETVAIAPETPLPWTAAPAKRRVKRLKGADPNASAADRLKAITEMTEKQGDVLVGLSPEAAADRLLDFLIAEGVVEGEAPATPGGEA
ncbi:MAG: hypothetical protein MI755_19220 [Sphingomonadales bacterium]|nr:hypothetical protein [Sphingomonadales bacterium]